MIGRLLFAALLAWGFAAHAATEESLREARALFNAMHLDRQLEAMTRAMSQAMVREIGNTGDAHISETLASETITVIKERAEKPGGLLDIVLQSYADLFTVEELRAARQFYESPAGQKILSKTPELMQRVMQQATRLGREAAPEICNRAKARLAAEQFAPAAGMRCPAPSPQ